MSPEENKRTIIEFYKHLEAQDAPGIIAMLTEDATWWVPTGEIGGIAQSRAAMAEILPAMYGVYVQPPVIELGRMIAEGNQVCVEQTARGGKTKGGLTYENDYLMLFTLRDGQICEVREYLNPIFAGALAIEVMGAAAS